MTRQELVKKGIEEARKERDRYTIIREHDNGTDTVETFYVKNKAIWLKMVTGCITSEFRVYKVNTEEPYIREMGRYWILGDREKEVVKELARAI